jgi:hypothetical protein
MGATTLGVMAMSIWETIDRMLLLLTANYLAFESLARCRFRPRGPQKHMFCESYIFSAFLVWPLNSKNINFGSIIFMKNIAIRHFFAFVKFLRNRIKIIWIGIK